MRSSRASLHLFAIGAWRGEVAMLLPHSDLEAAVAALTDPSAAHRTLHWGRNYLYLVDLHTTRERLPVVVKQFRNDGLRARLRRRLRGSKAERSWRAAQGLVAAGIPTPEPVMWIESLDTRGPSFFVSRHLEGVFEIRQLFRALAAGREKDLFPDLDPEEVLTQVGRAVRRLHDSGFQHRDLSMGNVLVEDRGAEPAEERYRIHLIDLNRTRRRRRLGAARRLRDLSRLPVLRADLRRALLIGYGGAELAAGRWATALLVFQQQAFLQKILWKSRVRGLSKRLGDLVRPRRPHPHIPPPDREAPVRERTVWDELSDQPHQHAGRMAKLLIRVGDSGTHARALASVVAAAPRIWRRYRQLKYSMHGLPVTVDGFGVGLRPWLRDPEGLLAAVGELGARSILVRLHPWQDDHDAEEELARELAGRGLELTFALPQTRQLVRDRQRWRSKIEELGERFVPFGRRFQIGQAINRSKWGIWTYQEYADLAADAARILRAHPGVELLGPAVIDFEFHATAAVLNLKRLGVKFDIVSSLLYVDRRGAPERRQLGFDTVGKVVLLKAIAETARNSGDRCWITEVNWPLREGPHAPAGRDVAVDEASQADYLVRYYLLALASGCAERIFWWQLVARGYGLVDPAAGSLRRRPSFHALRTLIQVGRGGRAAAPLPASQGVHLLPVARPGGDTVVVAWSSRGEATVELEPPPAAIVLRDGGRADPPSRRLRLTGSPAYLVFPESPPKVVAG